MSYHLPQRTLGMAAVLAGLLTAPRATATDPAELVRWVQTIRPGPQERKWEQIPWLLDPVEGLRLAREEGRPMLLWGSDDDPLERC
jgi:hypothetical protein